MFAVRRLPPPTANKLENLKAIEEFSQPEQNHEPDLAKHRALFKFRKDTAIVVATHYLQYARLHNVHLLANFTLST